MTDNSKLVWMCCSRCGSRAMSRHAWTEWSASDQRWKLAGLIDDFSCNVCGTDAGVPDKQPILTYAAAKRRLPEFGHQIEWGSPDGAVKLVGLTKPFACIADAWCFAVHNRHAVQTSPSLNAEAALRAILARIDGVFDSPDLLTFGPLGNSIDDIQRIALIGLSKTTSAHPPDIGPRPTVGPSLALPPGWMVKQVGGVWTLTPPTEIALGPDSHKHFVTLKATTYDEALREAAAHIGA